ncbi:MAG: DeoR/GlpR transcriptional regulator [Rhizobiales bacterium]|nr:DeoR/GlpR transcriptional regulator [Hyphomicrobiales bacterium]MBI3672461.1 DeoR/GlpR transcriptional regulator [Hyphomicrobiales bacterium]
MIGNEGDRETPAVQPEGRAASRARPLPQLRHAHILNTLAATGAVQVSAIAEELGVSDMTVRRDLIDLENAGRLVRIHGGAVDAEKNRPAAIDRDEPHFEARMQRQHAAKDRIAAAAARIAEGCRTIALDVGTTTLLLAIRLRSQTQAKIFTNSVRIASELGSDGPEVYLPGGRMRRDEMSIGGSTAVAQFQALWFDIAFVGVSGITPGGLYDYSFDDADMKRIYLRRSGIRVVLCDASKFERMSLVHIATLRDFNILVTDAAPPPAIAAALADAAVRVEIAGDATSSP